MKYMEQLAEKFGSQLIKHRRYNYSEQLFEHYFLDNPQLTYKFHKVPNKRQQNIETLLVRNTSVHDYPTKPKTCIIYAHGLGSNKLQVLPIMKHFKGMDFDICSFDFSGSGKSSGQFTSYGLRQQDDVSAVLSYLDQKFQYAHYILWGRSMGAVAIILSQGLLLNSKVKNIILDSPFSSFQKICLQIASKRSFLPELFLGPLLGYLKQYFTKKTQFNPFKMDIIEKIKLIDRKIIFVYSKNDSVVNYSHTENLKLNCSHSPLDIQIVQDHNMQRSKETHKKIYDFITNNQFRYKNGKQKSQRTLDFDLTTKFQSYSNRGRSQSRNRGISLTSKQNKENLYQENIRTNGTNRIKKSIGYSGTKINLMITQSMTLTRPQQSKEAEQTSMRLKPVSSMDLGRTHQIELQCQNRRSLGQPLSMISLNNQQANSVRQKPHKFASNKPFLRKDISSFFNQTQKFQQYGQPINTFVQKEQTSQRMQPKQPNCTNKIKPFYSASFINEDLGILREINSIGINRKFKEKELTAIKENPRGGLTPLKRPSIQLRRKNRFLL